jgi:hypothetical protein
VARRREPASAVIRASVDTRKGPPRGAVTRERQRAAPGYRAGRLQAEFERYCQTRVDIEGRLLGFDPQAATADAEWVKHRLSRAADTPPQRLLRPPTAAGLPPHQRLSDLPGLQTTAEFLPIHRQQARLTREQLAAAETAGRERLAANHRKVLINLDTIITSLQARRRPINDDDG